VRHERLRQAVDDYLAIRRGLGFKLRDHGPLLADFVDTLDHAGAATVTTQLTLAWATKPGGVRPSRWKQRLSVARGFAGYLNALDPSAEVQRQTCSRIAANAQPHTSTHRPTSPRCWPPRAPCAHRRAPRPTRPCSGCWR